MKAAAGELAIFGGPPAFAEPLHVGRPNVGDRDAILRGIAEAIEDRWLSNNGAKLLAFETELRRRLGTELHCVATCNGTLALQIALRALGVEGEVVLPAFTFVATAHAVAWERLTPVFADIEPETLCMGAAQAEERIGPETGALLGVHLWGRSSDPGALEQLARERGLPLLFDAAHALGCSRDGRSLAGYGDAAILSFHATKVANAFEGGAVVTADAQLADRVRAMRNFGFDEESEEVAGLGTNVKMSEASAAMGLASLTALDGFLAANRRNFAAYDKALQGIPGVELLPFPAPAETNCHHVTVVVDHTAAGLDRDALKAVLEAENVLARRYFHPGCHRVPPHDELPTPVLPVTEQALGSCLSLPTGTAVSAEDATAIGQLIGLAVAGAATVRERVGG